ncbi:MAG: N-acetyltransferase [Oscillospiraceae bacterium]|nr:N-acetyltransferase [Oscillospiraceae bacterium]
MDKNDYVIRLEKEEDYASTENLVREAFWNVYRPGCSEHYVLHELRSYPDFVRELDLVMTESGRLIGQTVSVKAVIHSDDGREIPVLTMGPVCIAPDLQRNGLGKLLVTSSLDKARELGFGAVLLEGNIGFYSSCGFDYAGRYGIRYHGLPDGADSSFFLCTELIPGYLDGVTGTYETPAAYYVDDSDVERFDKAFPQKIKLKLPGQLF